MEDRKKVSKASIEEVKQGIINGFNQIIAMEEVELETMLKMLKNMRSVSDNMKDDVSSMTALCVNKQNVLVMLGKVVGRDTKIISSLKIQ